MKRLMEKDGVLRVNDALVTRHPSHQPLVVLVDPHHRRHQPLPLEEEITTGSLPCMTGADRVGCTQIGFQ